jgi:hypothetical protein
MSVNLFRSRVASDAPPFFGYVFPSPGLRVSIVTPYNPIKRSFNIGLPDPLLETSAAVTPTMSNSNLDNAIAKKRVLKVVSGSGEIACRTGAPRSYMFGASPRDLRSNRHL